MTRPGAGTGEDGEGSWWNTARRLARDNNSYRESKTPMRGVGRGRIPQPEDDGCSTGGPCFGPGCAPPIRPGVGTDCDRVRRHASADPSGHRQSNAGPAPGPLANGYSLALRASGDRRLASRHDRATDE